MHPTLNMPLRPMSPVHAIRRAARSYPLIIALLGAVSIVGCSKPVDKTEDIRPVRAIKLLAVNADSVAEFAGEVRPRIESKLGFRVGGKIIERKVSLGTQVTRGQVLMQLDPEDLALVKTQAKAGLTAAESNRDLAKADLRRYQELREKNFISAAALEGKESASRSAQASYEQALAGYKNQSNQSGYATLVSDADGVVTSIDAEVGQVVAAGTPVIRLAQSGAMDVVIGIPEDKVNTIRQIQDIHVSLWSDQSVHIPATLRELSPIADPVTRTYIAKLALPTDLKNIKYGMTANVTFVAKNPNAMIKIPMTALFQEKNATSVWVVESGAVQLVPVVLGGTSGQDILLASGVSPGQTIVTAGVHLLKPGQKVKILGADISATGNPVPQGKVNLGAAK